MCFSLIAPGVTLRGLTFAACDATGLNCAATIVSASGLPNPPVAITNCTFTGLMSAPTMPSPVDGSLPALISVSNLGLPMPDPSTAPVIMPGVPNHSVPGLNLTDVMFLNCMRQVLVSAQSANLDMTRVYVNAATMPSFNYSSSLFMVQNTANSALYTTVRCMSSLVLFRSLSFSRSLVLFVNTNEW